MPSFPKIRPIWLLTVTPETQSSSAISVLEKPFPIRVSRSSSRVDREGENARARSSLNSASRAGYARQAVDTVSSLNTAHLILPCVFPRPGHRPQNIDVMFYRGTGGAFLRCLCRENHFIPTCFAHAGGRRAPWCAKASACPPISLPAVVGVEVIPLSRSAFPLETSHAERTSEMIGGAQTLNFATWKCEKPDQPSRPAADANARSSRSMSDPAGW